MEPKEMPVSKLVPEVAESPTVPIRHGTAAPIAQTPSPAEPQAPAATEGAGAPCPRCGAPLMNATSLGWCMKCGYCRSLENGAAKEVADAVTPKTSPLGAR